MSSHGGHKSGFGRGLGFGQSLAASPSGAGRNKKRPATNPIVAANAEAARMPQLGDLMRPPAGKASEAMKSAMVKPIPATRPTTEHAGPGDARR